MLLGRRWAVCQTLQCRVPYRMCTQAIDPDKVRGRVFKKLFKRGAPKTMEAMVDHLCRLARQGDVDTCWDLLEEGCDPNQMDREGWTALFYAASRGHDSVVSLLLDRGASPDSPDKDCWTPLMTAVDNENYDVVRTLVQRGADVQCVNKSNRSPLHLACATGRVRNAAILVDVGADVNCVDKNGWTPLHFAANKGISDITRALLRTGATVDARTKSLETPLHLAVRGGKWATAILLLKYGADPDARNKDGKTPLQLAHESGHQRFGTNLETALLKGKRPASKTTLPDVLGRPGVQVVHLDVGHQHYVTCRETLTYIPGSYFWMVFNLKEPIPPDFESPDLGSLGPGPGKELTRKSENHLVIDRNPKLFGRVIEYLRTIVYTRTKALDIPEDKYEADALLREARFYRIPPMVAKIMEETEFKMRKTLRKAMSPKRRRKVLGGPALYKPEKPSTLKMDKAAVEVFRTGGQWGNNTEYLEGDEI